MATKQQRRQEKQRKRQRERREEARLARRRRQERGRPTPANAAGWRLDEAWISQDWHDWEVVVHGIVSRVHSDGTYAYAAFEVDLADEGLRAVETRIGVSLGHVQAAAGERGTDGKAMVSAEPAAIARLALDGLAWRRERGLPDPKGLDEALALLDGIDPDDSPFDYRFGREDEEEDTVEVPARRGFFGRLRGLFGG